MSEMTAQEIKTACFVCCPMCDEKKCIGRFNCEEIKRFVEKERNDDTGSY